MIKKLKIRFVTTIMIILSMVFLIIIAAINYFNYQSNEHQISTLLSALVENDGQIPLIRPLQMVQIRIRFPQVFLNEKKPFRLKLTLLLIFFRLAATTNHLIHPKI